MKDGAHTHRHNGGGGLALVVVLGAVMLAMPLAEAIARILPVLITTVAVIAGLVVAGWIIRAVLAYRSQRDVYPEVTATRAYQLPEVDRAGREIVTLRQAVEELHARLAADRAALPGPARHEHLHFHGLPAEQVAAILAAVQRARPGDGGER